MLLGLRARIPNTCISTSATRDRGRIA